MQQQLNYRELLQVLLHSTDETVAARIESEPQIFNHMLFNEIRTLSPVLQNDLVMFERLRCIIDLVIRPISRNTIDLFLTIPDKAIRSKIAFDGWYLLNNPCSLEYWRELIGKSLSLEDKMELKKFIGLAKIRLHELFINEQNPEQALNYLKNHGEHLDTVSCVLHAVPFLSVYEPWQDAMLSWGNWFITHIVEEP